MEQDPHHTVIDWWLHQCELIDFHWRPRIDWAESTLDLVFRKGEEVRRLRFYRPRQVVIEQGWNGSACGIEIRDITQRGWQDCGVEVRNFECEPGMSFYAHRVELVEDEA